MNHQAIDPIADVCGLRINLALGDLADQNHYDYQHKGQTNIQKTKPPGPGFRLEEAGDHRKR